MTGVPLGGLRLSPSEEIRTSSRGRPGFMTGPDPAGQAPWALLATASAHGDSPQEAPDGRLGGAAIGLLPVWDQLPWD